MIAWNFYMRTATPFVRDFGLMGGRIAEMPYDGVAKEIFIEKLSAAHATYLKWEAEMFQGAFEEKPAIVIAGSENG